MATSTPRRSILPGHLTRAQTGTVIAATLGAVLEWYDLLVYAMFAVVQAKQFFPVADPSVSLLFSLGTFALAWLVRPIASMGRHQARRGLTSSHLMGELIPSPARPKQIRHHRA